MVIAIFGGCIGWFIGFLVAMCSYSNFHDSIYDHFSEREEREKMMRLNKIFSIALCLLIINASSLCAVLIHKEVTKQYVEEYLAVKTIIETSIENENLSGFERIELVKQASEENAELAKMQYKCKQWYGFDIDKSVLELEPIEL